MDLKGQIYRSYNNSFSENISLWEGVLVLKGQNYIRAERTSKRIALKKYFTLGGFFGSERPNIHKKLQ